MIRDVVIISKIGSVLFALMHHLGHWILNIKSKIKPHYDQEKMKEICPCIKKSMIRDVVIIIIISSKIGSVFSALTRHLEHWILNIKFKIKPQYGQGKMKEICPCIKRSMIRDVVIIIISKIGSVFFALTRHLAHWILSGLRVLGRVKKWLLCLSLRPHTNGFICYLKKHFHIPTVNKKPCKCVNFAQIFWVSTNLMMHAFWDTRLISGTKNSVNRGLAVL